MSASEGKHTSVSHYLTYHLEIIRKKKRNVIVIIKSNSPYSAHTEAKEVVLVAEEGRGIAEYG